MKNITTPRTLAEAEFVVGNRAAEPDRPLDWSSIAMLALFVVFLVMLYMGVL